MLALQAVQVREAAVGGGGVAAVRAVQPLRDADGAAAELPRLRVPAEVAVRAARGSARRVGRGGGGGAATPAHQKGTPKRKDLAG